MSYFLRIEDPVTVRRSILESGRGVVTVLKGYQDLLAVRDRKKEHLAQLQVALKELTTIGEELEQLLPEKSFKEVEQYFKNLPKPKAKLEEKASETPKKERPAPEQPQPDELKRLESALSSIEQRLSKL